VRAVTHTSLGRFLVLAPQLRTKYPQKRAQELQVGATVGTVNEMCVQPLSFRAGQFVIEIAPRCCAELVARRIGAPTTNVTRFVALVVSHHHTHSGRTSGHVDETAS
jgi:hypothetical protein